MSYPTANPSLAAGDYSTIHFGPAQTNVFDAKVKKHSYQVYSKQLQDVLPVLMPTMALNSTMSDYYWLTDMGQVYFMSAQKDRWEKVASIAADPQLAKTINETSIKAFADTFYTTGVEMDQAVAKLFGKNAKLPVENGRLALVDKNNVLYTIYNGKLSGIELSDAADPAKGLKIKGELDLTKVIPAADKIVGMQMTYDGYLIVNTANGFFGAIDREKFSVKSQIQITPAQIFFGPAAIDDANAIYAVSTAAMMKIASKEGVLSTEEAAGAWTCPIQYDANPAIAQQGGAVLGAPALMGFGSDTDKLVVITDGAAKCNLVAFWRDAIQIGRAHV